MAECLQIDPHLEFSTEDILDLRRIAGFDLETEHNDTALIVFRLGDISRGVSLIQVVTESPVRCGAVLWEPRKTRLVMIFSFNYFSSLEVP